MSYRVLLAGAWAQREFGEVQLGDERLNRRVVEVAKTMAFNPSASIPRQSQRWKKTKGAYRLFDHKRARFESISQAHWQRTRASCEDCPVVLMIQDTTWLDYSCHPQTQGMGWHGPGVKNGSGLLLHSVLAVEPQAGCTGRIIGLTHGKLWARTGAAVNRPAAARSRHRRSPDRESLRWSEAVRQIGAAPPHGRYLHVGDRESDLFNLYEQTQQLSGVGFVIRVSKDRNASLGHDTPDRCSIEARKSNRLMNLLRSMPTLGQSQLWIAPKKAIACARQPGRWAKLNVAGGPVTIWSPQLHRTGRALRCWALRVWEVDAPDGSQPIEWMILSSEPVNHLADALRIAEHYSLRWLIEQYHQCLKSGCKVEERQLESVDRLAPLIGMLCVVAVRLLQLKNNARLTPSKPAIECVPRELVQTLGKLIRVDPSTLSVRKFTHEVAKLGGFIGRKSDGEPGWRTLWHGWHELTLIHAGRELAELEVTYG